MVNFQFSEFALKVELQDGFDHVAKGNSDCIWKKALSSWHIRLKGYGRNLAYVYGQDHTCGALYMDNSSSGVHRCSVARSLQNSKQKTNLIRDTISKTSFCAKHKLLPYF